MDCHTVSHFGPCNHESRHVQRQKPANARIERQLNYLHVYILPNGSNVGWERRGDEKNKHNPTQPVVVVLEVVAYEQKTKMYSSAISPNENPISFGREIKQGRRQGECRPGKRKK